MKFGKITKPIFHICSRKSNQFLQCVYAEEIVKTMEIEGVRELAMNGVIGEEK